MTNRLLFKIFIVLLYKLCLLKNVHCQIITGCSRREIICPLNVWRSSVYVLKEIPPVKRGNKTSYCKALSKTTKCIDKISNRCLENPAMYRFKMHMNNRMGDFCPLSLLFEHLIEEQGMCWPTILPAIKECDQRVSKLPYLSLCKLYLKLKECLYIITLNNCNETGLLFAKFHTQYVNQYMAESCNYKFRSGRAYLLQTFFLVPILPAIINVIFSCETNL